MILTECSRWSPLFFDIFWLFVWGSNLRRTWISIALKRKSWETCSAKLETEKWYKSPLVVATASSRSFYWVEFWLLRQMLECHPSLWWMSWVGVHADTRWHEDEEELGWHWFMQVSQFMQHYERQNPIKIDENIENCRAHNAKELPILDTSFLHSTRLTGQVVGEDCKRVLPCLLGEGHGSVLHSTKSVQLDPTVSAWQWKIHHFDGKTLGKSSIELVDFLTSCWFTRGYILI